MGHLESIIRAFLDQLYLFRCPFRTRFLVRLQQIIALLTAIQVHGQQSNQLVQKDIAVSEIAYQHGLLERVEHDLFWNYQFRHNLRIDTRLVHLFLHDDLIDPLHVLLLFKLVNLLENGVEPLFEVLLVLASERPRPHLILQLKAILVKLVYL